MEPKHLGRETVYPSEYNPSLLEAIPRALGRDALGLQSELAFVGRDVWQIFELSWLNSKGQPQVALMQLEVPSTSLNIVESKSLKLYLQSYHFELIESVKHLKDRIFDDLSPLIGQDIRLDIWHLNGRNIGQPNQEESKFELVDWASINASHYELMDLDQLDVVCNVYEPDPKLLQVDTREVLQLHPQHRPQHQFFITDAFRSLCPVTSQPDFASIAVCVSGVRINSESLLQYIVSFRGHQGFHEQCIEQLFMDLYRFSKPFETTETPLTLIVVGRFTRRGGIDINPWRSTDDDGAQRIGPLLSRRQWRQ